MEAQLQRMDALLTRLEGIVAALVSGTGGVAPSGASDRPETNIIGPYFSPPPDHRLLPWQPIPQTLEEKVEEQKKIDAIIEKALAERQEPLPLAD